MSILCRVSSSIGFLLFFPMLPLFKFHLHACTLWKKGTVFSRNFPIIMDTRNPFFAKMLLVVCFKSIFSVYYLNEVLKIVLLLQFQYLNKHFHPLKCVIETKHLLDDYSNMENNYQLNRLLIISVGFFGL